MNTKREPLNVEMIPSVFNIPIYKNGTVEYFMGADAEVVKVLDTFFNVSGKHFITLILYEMVKK